MSNAVITYEEQQLMSLYNTGTRQGLLQALVAMKACLSQEETELTELTDSAVNKLKAMTDGEYALLDLVPDFAG